MKFIVFSWALLFSSVCLADDRVRLIIDHKMPSADESIRAKLAEVIYEESRRYELDPLLVLAVIEKESRWKIRAKSNRGCTGLTQVHPETMKEVLRKRVNPFNPVENVRAGARYLSQMIARFGSEEAGLRAYNAGPGKYKRYLIQGRVPMQVKRYASRVFEIKENLWRTFSLRSLRSDLASCLECYR